MGGGVTQESFNQLEITMHNFEHNGSIVGGLMKRRGSSCR